ncbi:MAG: PAS domain-containing protein [Sphingomonas adhaesiva]|uniref:PAS domain-containing protein n=1 Tax=Sphingomonas adhaesiva TaxID=28212 RepID=UPI002FF61955
MGHRTASEGHRVLICTPFGRDADSVVALLSSRGYDALAFRDLDAMAGAIDERVGVVLLSEEALRDTPAALAHALSRQPDWSEIPFVLLATPHAGSAGQEALRRMASTLTGNALVLERPLGADSLVSTIASTMRSRQRQFVLRDRLRELETSRQQLAQSEAELRTVADALPVLISFLDRDLHYRFANRAYEDWFGKSPAEIVGRHVREVVSDEGFLLREQDMRRALAGETVRLELPMPRHDGERRDAEIRYLPRRDASGAVDGFHVFAIDVTERKLTEEELAGRVQDRTAALEREMANRTRAEAALRQSQKMEAVGQLTGGIAHDFNNMLTGIIGALDIMRRRIDSGRLGDLDRFMDAASTSAQRAAGLTARLLAFSRRQSLDLRPTAINALVHSLEELLRRTVNENIALAIRTADDVTGAMVDANQLENAILNLAINARDAMPDGGQLTVETRAVELSDRDVAAHPDVEPGHYVVVAVSDTGVGIAPDVLEKVFDPFFTTKPIGQGTGLGLSMVYGLARQSGGQARIHSKPGVGTTVSLYLRAVDPVDDRAGTSPAPAAPQGAGQTVLLVEDDDSVRLLVHEVLAELSYHAVEAQEAQAAIAVLQSDRAIDLMISDVGLPGMNGRQLADIARLHRPDLPILFITGYAENAAIRSGFLGTNMAMITKPFALDALAQKIAEMLPDGRSRPR